MQQESFEPTSLSLLDRARANDQEAWQQIVHLYGPLAHRWCRRAGLNEDDTADVFQETFRSVSNHLETFKPNRTVGSFRCWLKTIVRTKLADHFQRLNRQPSGRGGTDAQLQLANALDPLEEESEEVVQDETAEIVQRAMELIRPEFDGRNWTAFLRVAIDGQSAVDVAKQMNINAQTVRQANYRIRRRLRVVLCDLEKE